MTSFSEIQQPTGMPTEVIRPENATPAPIDPRIAIKKPPENMDLSDDDIQIVQKIQAENPEIRPFPTPQEMIALGGRPIEDTHVFTPDDIREFNNMSSINPDQATERRPVTLQSLARPFPTENLPSGEDPNSAEAKITQALTETVRQAEQVTKIQEGLRRLRGLAENPDFQENLRRGWISIELPEVSEMMKVMGEISPGVHVSPSITNIEDYRADRASNTPPETSPANSPTDISKAQ